MRNGKSRPFLLCVPAAAAAHLTAKQAAQKLRERTGWVKNNDPHTMSPCVIL
jgi:hypothetical protein